MSRKLSEEARVIEYFDTKPIETVTMLLGIVKARVKARTPAPVAKARKVAKARTNAKAITGSAGTTTVVPGPIGVAQ